MLRKNAAKERDERASRFRSGWNLLDEKKEGGQVLGSVKMPAPARQRGSVSL
jgi:hypothetical protein